MKLNSCTGSFASSRGRTAIRLESEGFAVPDGVRELLEFDDVEGLSVLTLAERCTARGEHELFIAHIRSQSSWKLRVQKDEIVD